MVLYFFLMLWCLQFWYDTNLPRDILLLFVSDSKVKKLEAFMCISAADAAQLIIVQEFIYFVFCFRTVHS